MKPTVPPTIRRISRAPWVRATVSAALLALAQPMADAWPRWTGLLAFAALVPMLALPQRRWWKAGLAWLLCGYLYGLFLVHWMWVVHWIALLGLPLVFAVGFFLFGCFHSLCRNDGERLWLGGAAWAAMEYLRSVGPFSFCWGLLGYGPERAGLFRAWSSLLGPYATSYLVFLANVAVVRLWNARADRWARRKWAAALLALCIVAYVQSSPAPTGAPRLRALLVQGGHPQEVKWEVPSDQLLSDYTGLTRQAMLSQPGGIDLIVWPEVAVTDILSQRPSMRRALHQLVEDASTPLLFGVLEAATDERAPGDAYNTVYLFTPGGGEQRYDKTHLVPWGETVPFGDLLPSVRELVVSHGGGEMAAGRRLTIFRLPNGRRFACLICFESTLPHLAALGVRRGAEFLVAATNDAWFFDTAALPQHLWAAQARAVENRVPILRAANTGITCAITCTGEITGRIPDQVPGTSMVEIALPSGARGGGYTWGGDGLALFCLASSAGFLLIRTLHRKPSERSP